MNTDVNTKCHLNNTPGTNRRNIEQLEKPKDCLKQTETNTETGRKAGRQTTQTNRTNTQTHR